MSHPKALTTIQQSIFFDQISVPDIPYYNVCGIAKINGVLDETVFAESLNCLPQIFDMFSADFYLENSQLKQRFGVFDSSPLNIVNLEHENDSNAVAEALIKKSLNTAFLVGQERLIQINLYKLSEHEYWWESKFHHLVCDAYAILVYGQVVADMYSSILRSEKPKTDSVIGHYQDQVETEKRYLDSSKYSKDSAFWNEKFSELPEQLLRAKESDVAQKNSSGRISIDLDESTRQGLYDLANETQTGVQQVGLATIALYFSRTLQIADLVLGVVVHGRKNKAERNMLGTMAKDLPCRVSLDKSDSIGGAIKAISSELRQNYRHQAYPVNHLARDLQLLRHGRQQLIDVNFNYVPFDSKLELGGSVIDLYQAVSDFDRDPFQIRIYDYVGQPMQLHIDYRLDYFSEQEAQLMAQRFVYLFKQVAQQGPHQLLVDYDLIPDAEKSLLQQWNQIKSNYPVEQSVVSVFEHQVKTHPKALAAACGADSINYEQLNRSANRLARYLRAQGVAENSLVGVCVQRGIDMVVAIMAVLKAGGAYVPMDPVNPTGRIDYMLSNSQISLLLTHEILKTKYQKSIDSLTINALCLDADLPSWSEFDDDNLSVLSKGNSLAYMMYTSGSTGEPKGALVRHDGTLNHIWAELDVMEMTGPCNFLQSAASSSDISVWQILTPLLTGGSTVIIDNMADVPKLHDLIKMARLDIIELVPSVMRLLIDYVLTLNKSKRSMPSLKWMIITAEACPVRLANEWLALFPNVPIMNGYGPTEASDDITYYVIDRPLSREIKHIPIGKPLKNLSVIILDQKQQMLPIGVQGELCVSGVGVGEGYWRNPDKTAESFIKNNIPGTQGDVIYRTGDIGMWSTKGELEFAGRQDNQVKLRGFRVELGEIEAVIANFNYIKHAVVLAQKDSNQQNQLVCYYSGMSNMTFDDPSVDGSMDEQIRQDLLDQLPDYMQPKHFVKVTEFALNTAGKIDRKALAPIDLNAARSESFEAPINRSQSRLCTIWQDVLELPKVGISDNFFMLGGHSLLAGNMVVAIKQEFGKAISLTQLFQNPTVKALAELLEQSANDDEQALAHGFDEIKPQPADRYAPFALTPIQQAYWVGRSGIHELGNVATHDYIEIDVEQLNPERFNQVFNRLIDYHDMLRMVVLDDGQQQVLEQVPRYEMRRYDLSEMSHAAVDNELMAIRKTMHHQVMPSNIWPMFDVRISHLNDQTYRIHFSIDALMADAWSGGILQRQLNMLYTDPACSLPQLDLSFRDYVIAEHQYINQPIYQRSKQYWLERMADFAPAPDLPLAKSPAEIQTPNFVRREAYLGKQQWATIKRKAASYNLTPSSVLFTAFASILSQWSKNKRFTLNLTLFNRLPLHSQVYEIIGDFTSLTLLEVDHQALKPFTERAAELQNQLLSDLEHRYFSGVEVMRELGRQTADSQNSSFPVVFTSTLGSNTQVKGINDIFNVNDAGFHTSQTPQVWLDHIVEEVNGELKLAWEAVEALFHENMLDDMFENYQKLLVQLALDDEDWGAIYHDVFPSRQAQTRSDYNLTEVQQPTELLHQGFIEQAGQTPDRLAIVTSDQQFSYREILNLANTLAHELREQGARPNNLIAVVMHKCWQQIPAVMSILMAGGAYLPIDAKLPEERIRVLLEQGGVKQVITTAEYQKNLASLNQRSEQQLEFNVYVLDKNGCDNHLALLDPVQKRSDIAYVIFTSGSTGMPKGVVIDHLGALNTVTDINRRYEVSQDDSMLALSSLNFDLSVYDIFGLLAVGGKLVIPDVEQERDPEHWWQLIRQHKVSLWNTVPALMQIQVDHIEDKAALLPDFFRLVMMSGDWISVNLPDRIKAITDADLQVISLGGATEASIWSIFYPIEQPSKEWLSVPYGRPLDNQKFYVLDLNMQDCPEHVVGDLYIGGIGLALGYWKDQVKTDNAFVIHPQSGDRLYKTGDLGKFLPEGEIEFIGREDHQVKINGFRVELGEIEAAVKCHPLIRETVVSVTGVNNNDKRLVVYYRVCEESTLCDRLKLENDLQQQLKEKLPAYMVPKHYMAIDTVPLTANGKVDRKALPQISEVVVAQVGFQELPRNTLEKQIADCWQTIFRDKTFGINDNFFVLGGDSIMIIQLLGKLRNLGHNIPLELLYRHQTVAELAAEMAQSPNSFESRQSTTKIESTIVEYGKFDLAPMQAWFFDKFDVAQNHANLSTILDLKQNFKLESLAIAFEHVLVKHPMLRCQYHPISPDKWVAEVANGFTLLRGQLVEIPFPSDLSDAASQDIIAEQQQSLNLQQGKLVTLSYLTSDVEGEVGRLLITMHLLAADGLTMRIFIEDLFSAYQQVVNGAEIALNATTASYRYWRNRLVEQMNQDNWHQQVNYWNSALPSSLISVNADVNKANLFADLGVVDQELSVAETDALMSMPKALDFSVNELLLHALSKAHRGWTDSADMLIDFETHGRSPVISDCDLSRTAGWFTSLYPMAIPLQIGSDIEHIQQIKQQLCDVPMQGFAFNALRHLHPDVTVRDAMNALPQPQISFNYMGQFDQLENEWFSLNEQVVNGMNSVNQKRPHLLDISARIVNKQLRLHIRYNTKIHSQATINLFASDMLDQIKRLVATETAVDEFTEGA